MLLISVSLLIKDFYNLFTIEVYIMYSEQCRLKKYLISFYNVTNGIKENFICLETGWLLIYKYLWKL